jgi:hypothetical protein
MGLGDQFDVVDFEVIPVKLRDVHQVEVPERLRKLNHHRLEAGGFTGRLKARL